MQKVLTILTGILVLGGCTQEGPTGEVPDSSDSDVADDACSTDDECGEYEICEEQICLFGDRDDTFEDARPIFQVADADDPNVSRGMIHAAGDIDHYAYTAPGPEWLRVWTRVQGEADDGLDTVLSVYAPNGSLHDVIDDFATGRIRGFDSRMYVYLPTAGTWYFRVEDKGTFYEDEVARGDASFRYEVGIEPWGSVTAEDDSLDDPSIAYNVANGSTIYPWGFVMESPGDVDHATFTLPWSESLVEVYASPFTPGSDLVTAVTLRDPGGDVVMQKDDVGPAGPALYLESAVGDWTLSVTDAEGAGSGTHWGVVYVRTRAEGAGNPREAEPNDTLEDANRIDQERVTEDGLTADRGFLQGRIATPADQDIYAFQVAEGGTLRLACSSSTLGSLGDVDVEVIGPDEASLGTFVEGDDNAPDIDAEDRLTDLAEGTYALRFFDAEGGGPGVYYRCGVYVDLP